MPQISAANRSSYPQPAWEETMRAHGSSQAVMATFPERMPERVVIEIPHRLDAVHLAERVADLEHERISLQKVICDLLSNNEKLRVKLLELTSEFVWR